MRSQSRVSQSVSTHFAVVALLAMFAVVSPIQALAEAGAPRPLSSSALAEAYGFTFSNDACGACATCQSELGNWGIDLADFLATCRDQPAWGCLSVYFGIIISIPEAQICDQCRGCSDPMEA